MTELAKVTYELSCLTWTHKTRNKRQHKAHRLPFHCFSVSSDMSTAVHLSSEAGLLRKPGCCEPSPLGSYKHNDCRWLALTLRKQSCRSTNIAKCTLCDVTLVLSVNHMLFLHYSCSEAEYRTSNVVIKQVTCASLDATQAIMCVHVANRLLILMTRDHLWDRPAACATSFLVCLYVYTVTYAYTKWRSNNGWKFLK